MLDENSPIVAAAARAQLVSFKRRVLARIGVDFISDGAIEKALAGPDLRADVLAGLNAAIAEHLRQSNGKATIEPELVEGETGGAIGRAGE